MMRLTGRFDLIESVLDRDLANGIGSLSFASIANSVSALSGEPALLSLLSLAISAPEKLSAAKRASREIVLRLFFGFAEGSWTSARGILQVLGGGGSSG